MKNDSFELAECNSLRATASNNNHGAKLIWRNVSVFAKTDVNKFLRKKTQRKRIINNATGCVKPGVLLAVMGARYIAKCDVNFWNDFNVGSIFYSGAGKSTLMSALAHRNPAGTIVKGDILVNDRPVGPFMHRLSGFVHQDDLFNGALTVLEHITFMVCIKSARERIRWLKFTFLSQGKSTTGPAHDKVGEVKIGERDFGEARFNGLHRHADRPHA